MATTQQQPRVFDAKAAQRFAALIAGWDTGNPSDEAEEVGKGRAARRMAAERNIRVVDALELPEIRKALDDQMQPVRQPAPDVAALQAEIKDLRKKLAFVVPKLREVTEALTNERKETVAGGAWAFGIFAVALVIGVKFGAVAGVASLVLGMLVVGGIFFRD